MISPTSQPSLPSHAHQNPQRSQGHQPLCAEHFPRLVQVALDLFRRPSPSGREDLVRAYTRQHLERCGFAVSVDEAGNVLATRGLSESPELLETTPNTPGYPLLSFHMDCVSAEGPFVYHGRETIQQRRRPALSLRPLEALEITNGWVSSRGAFVLGGDDKCGGALALTLAAMTTLPMKIVASVQEEIGCVGIEQVNPRFFQDVAYALVLDRRGAHHLVVSITGQPLCQGTFAAAVTRAAQTTGLLVYAVEGALSDAATLARMIPNVVNLSVGYYHPHTLHERVSLVDLWRSYCWAYEALQSLPLDLADLDQFSSQRAEEAARLVCPQCRKLSISSIPTSAHSDHSGCSDDLHRFLCQCAEDTESAEDMNRPHTR